MVTGTLKESKKWEDSEKLTKQYGKLLRSSVVVFR